MELRPYQKEAIENIKAFWEFGSKKVLLYAPTGSGKGVILSHMMQEAAQLGQKAIFVVRGRELVKQGSKRLLCDHTIYMAGHKLEDKPIMVASIDTMCSRGHWPEADLIVIDEAHFCSSSSYQKMAAQYPNSRFLAVTATPWQKESIEHVATDVVQTCSLESLINENFLVGPKYFCPSKPDLSGVAITAGEYNQKQLAELLEKSAIAADIIKIWNERIRPRPEAKVLCFTSGVKQSKTMVERFLDAGVEARHMDADTPDDEREEIISQHKQGVIKVISNVGILTTGVDMPWITDIIDAAPTRSAVRYVQKLGRGTRKIPGKDFFFVWDHAGNMYRHGWIQDERPALIQGQPKSDPGVAPVKTCPNCFAAVHISYKECPECGYDFDLADRERKKKEQKDWILKEQVRIADEKLRNAMKKKNSLVKLAIRNRYKRGFVYHKLCDLVGEEYAKKVWPYSGASSVTFADLD